MGMRKVRGHGAHPPRAVTVRGRVEDKLGGIPASGHYRGAVADLADPPAPGAPGVGGVRGVLQSQHGRGDHCGRGRLRPALGG